jgi:purine-binding chemotaxis protein CheW
VTTMAKKQEILNRRAIKLARPTPKNIPGALEVLVFKLSSEYYGIETIFIQEAYPLKNFVQLPCVPPFVFGIMNVRRHILSIVNLKVFFDLPEVEITSQNKVIIISNEEFEYGILVDEILEVQKVPAESLQPALPTMAGIREEFLKGITSEGLIILSAAKLLSDKTIILQKSLEL